MGPIWIWIMVAVIAVAVELLTSAMIAVWFCGGAVVAAIMTAAGQPMKYQIIVFVAVSLLLLLTCYRTARGWMEERKKNGPGGQ